MIFYCLLFNVKSKLALQADQTVQEAQAVVLDPLPVVLLNCCCKQFFPQLFSVLSYKDAFQRQSVWAYCLKFMYNLYFIVLNIIANYCRF